MTDPDLNPEPRVTALTTPQPIPPRNHRRANLPVCPNESNHTKCPDNYVGWHMWAEKKSKTHKQVCCEGCDRLSIWRPK